MPSAPGIVTTTQLAKLLLLSERRIQQLVRAGIFKHAFDLEGGHELRGRFRWIDSVQAYIRYLRQELGSEDATETRFLDARSRRMIAVAEAAELRLKVLKGKLHRAEDVEFLMTNRDSAIRARILAIPARVGRLLIGQTDPATIHDLLSAELYSALDSLLAYDPAAFNEQNEEYLARAFPERGYSKELYTTIRDSLEQTNSITSDHRVAGSSPAGCKLFNIRQLRYKWLGYNSSN